jgi:hypothetical protein
MSHSLDFVGLDKKLFFLRHLIAGNKEFSRREQHYQGTKSDRNEEWDHYAARLRYIVSNELIEIAAKLRVIQDTAVSQVSPDYLRDLDAECLGNKGVGAVLVGNFSLTLRESCNKIIHANTFELIFQNARSTIPRHVYTHWNGICQLAGNHLKKQWRIALDVYRWSDAMDYFLQELAGNVDW